MYGPGAPPPTRSEGTVITLRVLFAAVGFLTCGLFACVPLFRVAILRGRWFNWTAAWVSLPLSIVCFAVVGTVEETDTKGDIALAVVMILGALASAYFLVTDIRLDNQRRQYAGYAPAQAPAAPPGYGYPPPSPYANTHTGLQSPVPHTPIPQHHPQPHPQAATPPPPVAHTPVPPPPPQRPAPARIDQVRAELDELSDYLRNHEGNNGNNGDQGGHHGGNHGGGR